MDPHNSGYKTHVYFCRYFYLVNGSFQSLLVAKFKFLTDRRLFVENILKANHINIKVPNKAGIFVSFTLFIQRQF